MSWKFNKFFALKVTLLKLLQVTDLLTALRIIHIHAGISIKAASKTTAHGTQKTLYNVLS